MALSGDQKAMLRLLAQREQGYEDIAALMGLSVEEVRTRVTEALDELDESAAPAASPPPEPPRAEPKPEPPRAKPRPSPSRSSKPAAPRSAPRLKLPKDKGALRGLAAGVAVVLIFVVLLVTGVFGGSDDSGPSTTTTAGTESSNGSTNASGSVQPTEAFLKPVDGGDSSGRAVFGRSGENVVLLVKATGLEPSPQGQSYTVSLARSSSQRVPLVATKANDSGEILGRFQVAPQILGLLASGFDQMEISLVPDSQLAAALNAAKKSKSAPTYSGTDVLRGTVTGPIVESGEG